MIQVTGKEQRTKRFYSIKFSKPVDVLKMSEELSWVRIPHFRIQQVDQDPMTGHWYLVGIGRGGVVTERVARVMAKQFPELGPVVTLEKCYAEMDVVIQFPAVVDRREQSKINDVLWTVEDGLWKGGDAVGLKSVMWIDDTAAQLIGSHEMLVTDVGPSVPEILKNVEARLKPWSE
jgi:hypothetical protein